MRDTSDTSDALYQAEEGPFRGIDVSGIRLTGL
jgi:hypothetical protein